MNLPRSSPHRGNFQPESCTTTYAVNACTVDSDELSLNTPAIDEDIDHQAHSTLIFRSSDLLYNRTHLLRGAQIALHNKYTTAKLFDLG